MLPSVAMSFRLSVKLLEAPSNQFLPQSVASFVVVGVRVCLRSLSRSLQVHRSKKHHYSVLAMGVVEGARLMRNNNIGIINFFLILIIIIIYFYYITGRLNSYRLYFTSDDENNKQS